MPAILYARRSSTERDERQVQSIDDQLRVMHAKAQVQGVKVVQEITESRSAKQPDNRPQFAEMLRLIDKGRADTIVCWHLNRLFRNSVDMGAIQWRLQQGVIRRIITHDRDYLPEDNVLLFYMEAGVSNQTVLDMSKAVRRGMGSKIDKGWSPHRAPPGYLNEPLKQKGTRTIVRDPHRFEMIRKTWDLILSGGYSPPEVQRILNEEWNYESRPYANGANHKMARNTFYNMLKNPFYAGYFLHAGKWHRGTHEAMITWDEYVQVQNLLKRPLPFEIGGTALADRSHRQSKKHNLTYCGLLHCSLCGGLVTGQQVVKKSGRRYVYYFCQNFSGKCTKTGIREDRLDAMVLDQLARLSLPPPFIAWAYRHIEQWESVNGHTVDQSLKLHQKSMEACESQLDALLTLKIKDLITDEEFERKRNALLNDRTRLRIAKDTARENEEGVRESIKNAVNYLDRARQAFATSDANLRRAVVSAMSSNLQFIQGKVLLEPHPLLEELKKRWTAIYCRFSVNQTGRY